MEVFITNLLITVSVNPFITSVNAEKPPNVAFHLENISFVDLSLS